MSGEADELTINTVTGPVGVDVLGRTLMHEHVFTFHSDMQGDYSWTDEERYVLGAIEKLKRLKTAGFDSLVDLTVFGLGRNVARVARIAEAAKFNIIVATGIYAAADMPTYFRVQLDEQGPSFLEDLFVREIAEGIGDTGIRAAVLKCVTDRQGLTLDVDVMLRSVARAQHRTGVPISTHTHARSQSGLVQQEVFRQEGIDLSEVIIGHCGDTTDVGYLERLIEAGSYLGMDRFGQYQFGSLEDRLATVATLCSRGYASRMLLSHDANCGGDLSPEESLRTWRYGHLEEVVLPALRTRGVSADDIELMLVANPQAIFGACAAKTRAPTDRAATAG